MDLQLGRKNALVTGGTRGIGRGITLALARAGVNVVACYRQDIEAAESLARELKETGSDNHLVKADVSKPEEIERLVEQCHTHLGSLDILVNNAGAISHIPYAQLPLDEWQRVLDTNLTGVYLVTQKALPLLAEQASIINIGSVVATKGLPLAAHYTASKAGLIGLTRSLCKELGPRGIRVNLICPGLIETEEYIKLSSERYQHYLSLTSLKRLGHPEELATVVLFLASDLSRYVTGATINVDGGI
jgi:3-oxoacyl-[acyl-carrier protein] reductase